MLECIIISELEHKIIKLTCCKWCGTEFIKKSNREVCCDDYCKKENRKEQVRKARLKHYKKYKNIMSEDERYGLGSGWLGSHMKTDTILEYSEIQKEMKRLKIKA